MRHEWRDVEAAGYRIIVIAEASDDLSTAGAITFRVPDGWERVEVPAALGHDDWPYWTRITRSHAWQRRDGMLMRPARVRPWMELGVTWGTWCWFKFSSEDGEWLGLDRVVEETAVEVVLSGWWGCTNPKCAADGITQHRIGESCKNGRRSWTREQVMREAVHPDSAPDVSLHEGNQEARPGTTTTGWSGGSGRGL